MSLRRRFLKSTASFALAAVTLSALPAAFARAENKPEDSSSNSWQAVIDEHCAPIMYRDERAPDPQARGKEWSKDLQAQLAQSPLMKPLLDFAATHNIQLCEDQGYLGKPFDWDDAGEERYLLMAPRFAPVRQGAIGDVFSLYTVVSELSNERRKDAGLFPTPDFELQGALELAWVGELDRLTTIATILGDIAIRQGDAGAQNTIFFLKSMGGEYGLAGMMMESYVASVTQNPDNATNGTGHRSAFETGRRAGAGLKNQVIENVLVMFEKTVDSMPGKTPPPGLGRLPVKQETLEQLAGWKDSGYSNYLKLPGQQSVDDIRADVKNALSFQQAIAARRIQEWIKKSAPVGNLKTKARLAI